MLQPRNALSGMDVTVFGMMTTAWQGNGLTIGAVERALFAGVEVGVRERGSEGHVFRPESAHAGYTQAGVK